MEIPVTLHSAGPVAGIPGHHGPGSYLVDYEARTVRPFVDEDAIPATDPTIPYPADSATTVADGTSTTPRKPRKALSNGTL